MRILKWTGVVLGAVVVVAGALYLLRTDPIYMVSGKRLSGDELPYPADWSMCSHHQTIAVEARVDDPHSVTTICFVHDGDLIVPAMNGSEKQWPAMVVRDPPRPGKDRRCGLSRQGRPPSGCLDGGPAPFHRRQIPANR